MRRVVVLLALAAGALAPHAQAATPCGVTASAASGAAPLSVTFTAACASSGYRWDFGDGTQATGQVVQHVFAAGSWAPAVTTDLGSEPVPPVTSVSLHVS